MLRNVQKKMSTATEKQAVEKLCETVFSTRPFLGYIVNTTGHSIVGNNNIATSSENHYMQMLVKTITKTVWDIVCRDNFIIIHSSDL